VGPLSFSLHYEYTSLGAVALGAAALVAAGVVALGAAALVALVAAAGSPSATGTPAGSDALLQLLQLETDMLHKFHLLPVVDWRDFEGLSFTEWWAKSPTIGRRMGAARREINSQQGLTQKD